MMYHGKLFWTFSTCIFLLVSQVSCQTTLGTTTLTTDSAKLCECYEGECRKSEMGGNKCGIIDDYYNHSVITEGSQPIPMNQTRSDRFCISFVWTSLTAASPQKPNNAIRREVGNVPWADVTKITSKLTKTANQTCVSIDNLEVMYPNLTGLYTNATMCACNTNKCNTGYMKELFAENPTSSLYCVKCGRFSIDKTFCDPYPQQCISDEDACMKWGGLLDGNRTVYLKGCVDVFNIARYGVVGQCLANSAEFMGVPLEYGVVLTDFENTTVSLCRGSMCNDDIAVVAGHVDCNPAQSAYVRTRPPKFRATTATADCLIPPFEPFLIGAAAVLGQIRYLV